MESIRALQLKLDFNLFQFKFNFQTYICSSKEKNKQTLVQLSGLFTAVVTLNVTLVCLPMVTNQGLRL